MAYTSPELVQKIIKLSGGDTTDNLDPFIETAGSLVVALCTQSGYGEDTLELIERWLAAHFYAISRPRNKAEAVTGQSGVSQNIEDLKVDLNLANTKWGQQAMAVDYLGNLAAMNNRIGKVTAGKASIRWLGMACGGTA